MIKKRKKIIIIIFIIIVVIISLFVFREKDTKEYDTAKVVLGDLEQTVSEVGTVKAAREIDLSFLQAGKVAKILVKIGDIIKQDQILAELDYGSLSIKQEEAQASLEVAKANLNKLLAGATTHEIAVSQASVDQARTSYLAALDELEKTNETAVEDIKQAQKDLADLESDSEDNITPKEQAVTTAQINLDNTKATYRQAVDNKKAILITIIDDKLAVAKNALDNIDRVLNDNDAKSSFSIKNTSYKELTESSYDRGVLFLAQADASLLEMKNNQNDTTINKAVNDAISCLNLVFESLDYCYSALENSSTSNTFTQADLSTHKINISAQLTVVNTAISAVQTADQNLSDAELNYYTKVAEAEDDLAQAEVNLNDAIKDATNNLASVTLLSEQSIIAAQSKRDTTLEAWELAKAQLAQTKSPARIQDITLSQAQVKQAEASLNLIKKQIEDSIIKAPIDGTIVKIEYEVGEQISATKPAISILGENDFEIEIDISEADIAKVNINNPVIITLDAFGEDKEFTGNVYFIEPAETIIQDVIYYKVKIRFTNLDDANRQGLNIKSGMTANAVITTAKKKNILVMPSRAVIQKNGGGKIVRVLKGSEIEERTVELGLKGDGGMVEVLSGVSEGEDVVTFVKDSEN